MHNIIYHHNDNDGRLAAYLVCRYLDGLEQKYECVECQYGMEPPSNRSLMPVTLWVLDFSFSPNIMIQMALGAAQNLVWLDHHKSAFERMMLIIGVLATTSEDYIKNQIYGIQDHRMSGCELAYIYLERLKQEPIKVHKRMELLPEDDDSIEFALNTQKKYDIPQHICLIGDYDTWRWQSPDYEYNRDDVEAYNYAMNDYAYKPDAGQYRGWDNEHRGDFGCPPQWQATSLKHGRTIKRITDKRNRAIIKALAWRAEFDENQLVMLNGPKGALVWGDIFDRYPMYIFISYSHEGNQFRFSARSKMNTNVKKLAEQFGGGGHDLAAGFVTKEFPDEFKYLGKLEIEE